MKRLFPYDDGLTLRELLMCLGIAVFVAAAYLMATAQPHPPTETRSSTPEAWTPATASEPVEVEAP